MRKFQLTTKTRIGGLDKQTGRIDDQEHFGEDFHALPKTGGLVKLHVFSLDLMIEEESFVTERSIPKLAR